MSARDDVLAAVRAALAPSRDHAPGPGAGEGSGTGGQRSGDGHGASEARGVPGVACGQARPAVAKR